VVYRVSRAPYAGLYTAALGRSIFDIDFPANTDDLCEQEGVTVPLSQQDRANVNVQYDNIALAIAAYEGSVDVNTFSSKYDAWLEGRATLTAQERFGLELFEGKAMCAACHPSSGGAAAFTDFTYDNLGVPRNPNNPVYQYNPGFVDLGLGGFLGDPTQYGKQKVPTLRNVDRRPYPGATKAFTHNGVFKTLEELVHFYNTRDVLPSCNVVQSPRFGVNCWPPPEVQQNVNVDELGNLGLTDAEEKAIVSFLQTLTDGYTQGKARGRR
jgi:cytochrome c peroxidase